MTNLQKHRISHVLKWVSFISKENSSSSSKPNPFVNGPHQVLQHTRFSTTAAAVNSKNVRNLGELAKNSRVARREAQAALLDYLHSTRSLQFMDAENMSKNTPEYFDRLLKRVELEDEDIGKSFRRFLRYHPINEFEPFFESIGLKHSEYLPFLPRSSVFLHDDELLLENYYALCNYGVVRKRIGKIYKEAREIFRYDYGVLSSKLRSFEQLGLRQSLVVNIIASSPCLLKQNVNGEFIEALEKLKKAGIQNEWLEEHISEGDSYNWKFILDFMSLLSKAGLSEEQLGELIMQHPDLLLENSVHTAFHLFGFLSKFGFMQSDMKNLFLQLPNIPLVKFTKNLCQCYQFLVEINMNRHDIGKIVRSYPIVLGSCELKRVKSLLCILNCGTKRLCQMILDDPNVLKKWVLGVRVDQKPEPNRIENVRLLKTNFLLNLGFIENSKEMEKALKVFRGKGLELQERFDCLVDLGLSKEEVMTMLKVSPQILNQSKEVIKMKIGFFVDLGYSVSDLLSHPPIISYSIERVKLRLLMYKWLREEMLVHPKLSLSTLLSSSEEIFMKSYVKCHPSGPEYWETLKQEIYSEN